MHSGKLINLAGFPVLWLQSGIPTPVAPRDKSPQFFLQGKIMLSGLTRKSKSPLSCLAQAEHAKLKKKNWGLIKSFLLSSFLSIARGAGLLIRKSFSCKTWHPLQIREEDT